RPQRTREFRNFGATLSSSAPPQGPFGMNSGAAAFTRRRGQAVALSSSKGVSESNLRRMILACVGQHQRGVEALRSWNVRVLVVAGHLRDLVGHIHLQGTNGDLAVVE